MREVRATRFGGPEVLELGEAPEPVAGPGEVVGVVVVPVLMLEAQIRGGWDEYFGVEPPYEILAAPGWRDTGLVFPNRVGKPINPSNLYHREYKPLLKQAGLEAEGFTFHSLRHTFASGLCNKREYPKVIQALLGHSSITQTMDTYSHLLDDVDDDEVGGLDEAFG